jgi:hypothetical protein
MLMKKALLIGIALGLLIGAWAVPAMAIDWSASGLIYVTGAVHEQVPSLAPYFNPNTGLWWNRTWAWVRMGANLNITAKTSDDLYGVLNFNMVSNRWGEPDQIGWGFNPFGTSQVNSMGSWYKKETGGALSVLIKDAFIDFRVPPKLPVRMRVGVQPIILRPKVFMFYDGPGISMPITIAPINLVITPAWYKKWEGFDWRGDDSDVIAVDANVPIGPIRIGSFFWWENHNTWGTLGVHPLNVSPDSLGSADFWWVGAYSDGKIGPIGYELDFVYEDGQVDYYSPATPDFDVSAWVIRGQVTADIVPRLTFGIGGFYATGEDYGDPDGERYTQPNTNENWYGGMVFPNVLGANGCPPLQDFLMLHGNFMGIVPCFGPSASFLMGPSPMGGVWYVRGFAQYMVTDWLRVAANFGYIGDTADQGNTLTSSTGMYNGVPHPDSDEIGWELDVGASVNIYKNLVAGLAFGYLWAGNGLDEPFAVPSPPAAAPFGPYDSENAWIVQLGLAYFF